MKQWGVSQLIAFRFNEKMYGFWGRIIPTLRKCYNLINRSLNYLCRILRRFQTVSSFQLKKLCLSFIFKDLLVKIKFACGQIQGMHILNALKTLHL